MNKKPNEKPIFLYIVIGILTVAVIALAAVSFLSLNHLVTLQQKVQTLSKTVEEISTDANTLISQADQLDELREQESSVKAATGETSPAQSESAEPSSESEQQNGTLSPSSNNTFTDNTDSSMDNLLNQVQSLLPSGNGTWSVYVCNLAKNTEGSINDQQMQAASLIKLYIMGAVYEDYDSLSATYGKDKLDDNLNSMITVSDNDAANTLINYLGGGDDAAGMARVNKFCQDHGYTSTSMGRLLLADNSNGDNYTSVKDCGKFLKTIYQIDKGTSTDDTLAGAEYMYHLLKMQTRTNKIPAQMPEGVKVANKTGELDTVENDAGIIYDTAKGIDLVVCFMSQDLNDTAAAQNSIAQISRSIYGYYNE